MLKRMDPADDDEVMTSKDAAMFPVYGSAVLFSLYLLCKYFNKDILSTLLSIYFTFLGNIYTLIYFRTNVFDKCHWNSFYPQLFYSL